jgi:hydroxymethylpyrimidine pyrophosphatase-like HAD family hydrolase
MRLYGLIKSKKIPLEISSSGLNNLEIMPIGNDKGTASMFLATYLRVDHDNVLALGDERNDISMLKAFKHSVTLSSSKPDVKKAANFVYDSKPSIVVRKAIEELIFKNE